MINARMETVAEKPAFRRAFAARRCLLPADGYFEWYPTEEKTKAGKPKKQPYFIRPTDGGVLAMAGLYEIWRDPTRDEDDPDAVPVDLHGADHPGRGRPGPHPRPDAADGARRDRWGAWLDPAPARHGRPARAAGAGRARAGWRRSRSRRWSATSATTGPSWSRRSRSEGLTVERVSDVRTSAPIPTPTATPGWSSDGLASTRSRPCCSATAPAAASTPSTSPRWPPRCPGRASPCTGSSSRGGWPAARSPPPPADARRVLRCAADQHPAPHARWCSAAAAPAPARRPHARAASAPPACWRCPSRCTRRAGPRSRGSTSSQRAGVPTLVIQGERDPFGRPEEFPDGHRPGRRTRGRPLAEGAEVGAAQPGRTRWRSWSRRPWSGSCARSPGIEPAEAVFAPIRSCCAQDVPAVLATPDRSRPLTLAS